MTMRSVDPRTERVIREYPTLSHEELEERLTRAERMRSSFAHAPLYDRTEAMARAASLLEDRADVLARLMTMEMGKPIGASMAEVRKCAWVCRYYADRAAGFLADEMIDTGEAETYVRFEPLGVVLAVMPWNFPLWQVFRFAAPALAAGNVCLLKHASNVPGCALAIERLLVDAGFPPEAFQTLLIPAADVDRVVADPRVSAVTLTGSEPAGRAVARTAGEHLKKTVLELGGSDPFIVLADADLEAAVRMAVKARTINNGQSCIAAKRFILERSIAPEFEERVTAGMKALRVGDPLDPATDLGPLATQAIREELHKQVRATVEAGARLVTGGSFPEGPGFYYPATVLADVPAGAPAAAQETFGPVAALLIADSAADALRIANDSAYGLGASAWTTDGDSARMFIEGLEAGSVFINGMVASDPRLPFGGIKRSGYGRELGRFGMQEFLNIKTVFRSF
jgi:succinate-semialdehyde dehydrogenase/glutarate-semialdehyde dehydrogenase